MSQDEFSKELFYTYVFTWMEKYRVTKLVAFFNGSGDSGSFEDYLNIQTEDPKDFDGDVVRTIQKKLDTDKVQLTPHTLQPGCSFQKYVLYLSRQVEREANHGINWWDDDGGQGTVEWILAGQGNDGKHYNRGICLTVEERITTYEATSFSIQGAVPEKENVGPSEDTSGAVQV